METLDEESILREIESSDYNVKLSAVKTVKNRVIGNDLKKKKFLDHGTIPRLSDALKRWAMADMGVFQFIKMIDRKSSCRYTTSFIVNA